MKNSIKVPINHNKALVCSVFGMSKKKYLAKQEEFMEFMIKKYQISSQFKFSELAEVMIKDCRNDILGDITVPIGEYEAKLFLTGAMFHELMGMGFKCQIEAERRTETGE